MAGTDGPFETPRPGACSVPAGSSSERGRIVGSARVGMLISVCAVICGALSFAGSAAAVEPQTISVLEVDTSLAGLGGYDPDGGTLPSPGQGISFSGTLYRWAGTRRGARIGHVQAVCTRTTGPDALCNGVISLPAGTLELLGPTNFASSAPSEIAIVGGTGAYIGAKGAMRTVNIGGKDSSRSDDTLRIVG